VSRTLHQSAIVVDGACVIELDRSGFEALHSGGVTAANYNWLPWQGFTETMKITAELKAAFAENSDIVRQVYSTEDIHAAKREDRVGIILGWQNTSPIEDKLYYLSLSRNWGWRSFSSRTTPPTGWVAVVMSPLIMA
jgi:membrane dipeptidase